MQAPTLPPKWNIYTKLLVTVIVLLVALALMYIARNVIWLVALAAVIAYIFQPIISWLMRHRISRAAAAALCLFGLLLLLAIGPVLITPALVDGISSLIDVLVKTPDLFQQWTNSATQTPQVLHLGNYTVDLTAGLTQIQQALSDALGDFALPSLSDMMSYLLAGVRTAGGILQTAVGIASGVVSAAFSILLLLVLTFFLSKDGWQFAPWVKSLFLPQYRTELDGLTNRLNGVWKSFFRGQLLLALIIGVVVFITTALLGLPGALILGILAGLLEVIPNLGPVLALIPALLVALIQGSTTLPVSNLGFALIVLLAYLLIQQLENNFLVPRIMGQSLNLHPLLVMLGVVVGASFGGILGAFLAAPILASLKVIGEYIHAKLLDQDPLVVFAEEERKALERERTPSFLSKWLAGLRRQRWLTRKQQAESAVPKLDTRADNAAVKSLNDPGKHDHR